MKTRFKLVGLTLVILSMLACHTNNKAIILEKDTLLVEFKSPPNTARPRVWWHWMNGNITQHGIRKDLEWMHRIGLGGFQNFDANLFTPLVVDKKLEFMQPDWKDAFLFATELADSLGLEMAIAGSPGWSESGGPWVKPRDGMKKYVWSEMDVEGGRRFEGELPQPPGTSGPFQNVSASGGVNLSGEQRELPEYYQDAAVFAYPLTAIEVSLNALKPRVYSSGGQFSVKQLTDGDLQTANFLPPGKVGEEVWIQYEFDTPQTFKSYSIVGASHSSLEQFRGSPQNRSLLVSDDGKSFRKVANIPGTLVPQTTGNFPATSARYWRFVYKTLPPPVSGIARMLGRPSPAKPEGVDVAEFVLYPTDRIQQFENKAGFSPWVEKDSVPSRASEDAIPLDQVVDLTNKLGKDGTLNWEVPDGRWRLVRLGYSLTGRENHPASPEATGLEVDKLDEDAVRSYINTYLDMYKDATGGMMGKKGLGYMTLDSYEAGHLNWTHDMFEEFSTRRGYDMKPWLPVLTGRIVKSRTASEEFLWDFRKTIGEMIAENHYDVIGEELHKRDMGRYTESHENRRIYLADGMDVKRNADVPMAAMWTPGALGDTPQDEAVRSMADIRESASVANIYGQNVVAAESMTSIGQSFIWYPGNLKRTADMELASGLNRFVIHTSVHQPLDDKMPGFTLGPFGQYFTRQETWAGQAKPWIDYLARSSYMLQQGKNVADILYYYGENHNITMAFEKNLPPVPAGYEYDFINATGLMDAISVNDGILTAKSGNTYKLLVLDKTAKEMTLPVLRKLIELVKAGAKVTGTKPERSPSLKDDPEEFNTLAAEVWANQNVLKGSLEESLGQLGVEKDVDISGASSEILYRHRHTAGLEIYWLDNRSDAPTAATFSFRVTGKVPELWNPQTGETSEVSYTMKDGRTIIPLDFESWGAFFMVFGKETDTRQLNLPERDEKILLTIDEPWNVSFQEGRGAPAEKTFRELKSWSEQEDPGIKYFSGTATYRTTFDAPEANGNTEWVLDLGEVKDIAGVSLNGQALGILWKKPYTIPLGDILKSGQNTLEVKVTNVWVNRLIGDAQPDVKKKITFTTMPFYKADAPLLPSGLLGPVKILTVQP